MRAVGAVHETLLHAEVDARVRPIGFRRDVGVVAGGAGDAVHMGLCGKGNARAAVVVLEGLVAERLGTFRAVALVGDDAVGIGHRPGDVHGGIHDEIGVGIDLAGDHDPVTILRIASEMDHSRAVGAVTVEIVCNSGLE